MRPPNGQFHSQSADVLCHWCLAGPRQWRFHDRQWRLLSVAAIWTRASSAQSLQPSITLYTWFGHLWPSVMLWAAGTCVSQTNRRFLWDSLLTLSSSSIDSSRLSPHAEHSIWWCGPHVLLAFNMNTQRTWVELNRSTAWLSTCTLVPVIDWSDGLHLWFSWICTHARSWFLAVRLLL